MIGWKRVEAAISAAEGFDCSTKYESRHQRPDAFERIGVFLAGVGEVVHVLEVEPEFGRGAEVLAEAQRGGGGDALTALDDGSDPAVGQAGILGKPVLGDAQIAERFLERLTGMGIVKEWGGFHGGFPVCKALNHAGKMILFTVFVNRDFSYMGSDDSDSHPLPMQRLQHG